MNLNYCLSETERREGGRDKRRKRTKEREGKREERSDGNDKECEEEEEDNLISDSYQEIRLVGLTILV